MIAIIGSELIKFWMALTNDCKAIDMTIYAKLASTQSFGMETILSAFLMAINCLTKYTFNSSKNHHEFWDKFSQIWV